MLIVILTIVFSFCPLHGLEIKGNSRSITKGTSTFLRLNGFPKQAQLLVGGNPIPTFSLNASETRYALVGHPLRSEQKSLSIEVVNKGQTVQKALLSISGGQYPRETVTVGKGRAKHKPKDDARIKGEWKEAKAVYDSPHNERLWRGHFKMPVTSKVTSPFGVHRVFNGAIKSFHRGLDLRAPVGTKIKVTNRGVVRMARHFFYAGNHVIVDHGLGLFTTYSHLSKILVKPGQQIQQGALVGLSGATGRVSGPHLHWGARLGGQLVDPKQLADVIRDMLGPKTGIPLPTTL